MWRTSHVRRALKDVRLDMLELRRELRRDRAERQAQRSVPDVVVEATIPAWRTAPPARVSTITALYNRAESIEDALDSVLAGTYRDVELVVVD